MFGGEIVRATKEAERNGVVTGGRNNTATDADAGKWGRAGVLCAVLAAALLLLPPLWAKSVFAFDLKGEVTLEQLYINAPEYEEKEQAFTPKAEVTAQIGRVDKNIKIIVFLGTWCPDSKLEVPGLLKIIEAANNPHISVELHAVDRSVEDGAGFALQYGVRRVPTMIFMQDGKELGRIIEHPRGSIEEAVLAIVRARR